MAKLATIQAKPLQIRQLLENLTANALKFQRGRQEPPVVSIDARYVTPREQRGARGKSFADREVRTVEDNGVGFNEQYADGVLGIFQRLQHPLYEGTGIGLAISQRDQEEYSRRRNQRARPRARPGLDI